MLSDYIRIHHDEKTLKLLNSGPKLKTFNRLQYKDFL